MKAAALILGVLSSGMAVGCRHQSQAESGLKADRTDNSSEGAIGSERIILGKLASLPFGERASCDKAHLGRLTLTYAPNNHYSGAVNLCVYGERFGSKDYYNESHFLKDEMFGSAVIATRVASAVVLDESREKIAGWVISYASDLRNGTASCGYQSNVTHYNGSCGQSVGEAETDRAKSEIDVGGERVSLKLEPVQGILAADEVNRIMVERIEKSPTPDDADEHVLSWSFVLDKRPVEEKTIAIKKLQTLVKSGKVNASVFVDFVGNLGTPYGKELAMESLKSSDPRVLDSGFSMVANLPNDPEIRKMAMDTLVDVYPKSFESTGRRSDYELLIDTLIRILGANDTAEEKAKIRGLRDSLKEKGTNDDVESYLRSFF